MLSFFFFFSSRRRHTRWTGDWSSDVCSSDLERKDTPVAMHTGHCLADPPDDWPLHQPVERPGGQTAHSADKIGGDEPPVPPTDPSLSRQAPFPEDHQMGKIDLVLVRRRVGAVIEAELAIVTFIDNLAVIF